MKHLKRICLVCLNECKSILRDHGILTFIIFVPLVYPLLYSYVYTNEVVRNVPVAVVDNSGSRLSREFVRKMDATPDVNIKYHTHSMAEAEELLKQQKVYGILQIPKSFNKDLYRGEQTHVGIYCDMASMLYYKALMLSANNVALEMNRDIKISDHLGSYTDREDEVNKTPIRYDYIPLYNPQSGFAAFLIPPILMLIIQQTILLGIGMSAGNNREKYSGRLFPMTMKYNSAVDTVIGKGIPFFILYILLGVYMFTFVSQSFGLPRLGDYWTFLKILIPFVIACICFGFVLSKFVYRREDCILLFVFLSVPLVFLSGISWPGSEMPQFWKYISYIFPSTFGMNGYTRIAGMGASLSDIKFEYCGLWIQSVVYFILATIFYHFQISRKREKQYIASN